ncbi:hypothetical protein DRN86_03140 [Candidatus Geothermarchaeota archaeon]|nr:MAG: hypothetical protein DRN86_03140 [Candidatus Geothermarchaeota archaeon]
MPERSPLTLLRDYIIILFLTQGAAILLFYIWLKTNPLRFQIVIVVLIVALLLAFVWPICLGLILNKWRRYKRYLRRINLSLSAFS